MGSMANAYCDAIHSRDLRAPFICEGDLEQAVEEVEELFSPFVVAYDFYSEGRYRYVDIYNDFLNVPFFSDRITDGIARIGGTIALFCPTPPTGKASEDFIEIEPYPQCENTDDL